MSPRQSIAYAKVLRWYISKNLKKLLWLDGRQRGEAGPRSCVRDLGFILMLTGITESRGICYIHVSTIYTHIRSLQFITCFIEMF
jgi:hypothetical protein